MQKRYLTIKVDETFDIRASYQTRSCHATWMSTINKNINKNRIRRKYKTEFDLEIWPKFKSTRIKVIYGTFFLFLNNSAHVKNNVSTPNLCHRTLWHLISVILYNTYRFPYLNKCMRKCRNNKIALINSDVASTYIKKFVSWKRLRTVILRSIKDVSQKIYDQNCCRKKESS